MKTIAALLMLISTTALGELDFKHLAATKRDQPASVIITVSIQIPIQYGTFEIPKGSEVNLLNVSGDGKLTVQYNGSQYAIPASKTDIEKRVVEIRSRRLVVNGIEYQDFRFSKQTPIEVTIIHRAGITTVKLADLPPEIQKQLGYDPEVARKYLEKLEADKRALEELKRKEEEDANRPLDGKDLTAWKLARVAAEEECGQLNNPPRTLRPAGAPVAGSASAYAIIAGAQNAAMRPTYELRPEPRQGFMQKSSEGDWIFAFPVQASYYNAETKARVPKWEHIGVHVTDYGTEIRVESVVLDPE